MTPCPECGTDVHFDRREDYYVRTSTGRFVGVSVPAGTCRCGANFLDMGTVADRARR